MEENSPPREPEVFFCDLCQESIPEKELARGMAVEIQGRRVCQRCRRKLVPPLPSARWAALFAFLALAAAAGSAGLVYLQKRELGAGLREVLARMDALEEGRAEEARTRAEALREVGKDLRRLDGALGEAGKTWNGVSARVASLESALQSFRKELLGREKGMEEKFLSLAERLSALEAAVGKSGRTLLDLSKGMETLAGRLDRLQASSQSPPAEAKGEAPGEEKPAAPGEKLAGLAEELKSSEPDRRWKAVESLEKIPSPQAVRLVARALSDPDIWVRRLAAEALGRMGLTEAVGPLIRALADKEPMIRAAAAASLRTLTGKNFGFDPNGSPAARRRAMGLWKAWWARKEQKKAGPKG